jgi:hypothetical protein
MFNLVELFTWKEFNSVKIVTDRCRLSYLGHRVEQVAQLLRAQKSDPEKAGVAEFTRELLISGDESIQTEVLLSPELAYRLSLVSTLGPLPVFDFVTCSRLAVGNLQPTAAALTYGAWSALGNRYLPNCNSYEDPLAGDGWLSDASKAYESPKTPDGIVIDFCSPFARRGIHANNFRPAYSEPVRIPDKDSQQVVVKLEDASRYLQMHCPTAAMFVREFIGVVMPRVDKGIEGYQGGSNRAHMGRANLLNPHLDYINAYNVASSLVHEAIHIFLYRLEIWQRPSRDIDGLYRPTLISPWTNQQIHLLAFIHASFVWYGLRNLWREISRISGSSNAVAEYYIATATIGFHNIGFKAIIEEERDNLHPMLIDQLSALYRSS